jgi:hypothetical protein
VRAGTYLIFSEITLGFDCCGGEEMEAYNPVKMWLGVIVLFAGFTVASYFCYLFFM